MLKEAVKSPKKVAKTHFLLKSAWQIGPTYTIKYEYSYIHQFLEVSWNSARPKMNNAQGGCEKS